MILLATFVIGLTLFLVRGGKLSSLADLPWRAIWLVPLAFMLQVYVVYVPDGRMVRPSDPVALLHMTSYVLLAAFVWLNRRIAGVAVLGIGLALNFAVIATNGGFMPIQPDVVSELGHGERVAELAPGFRVHMAKDVLLEKEQTRLWVLSDILVMPPHSPLRSAFSLGDVFVAGGVLLLLLRSMPPNAGRSRPRMLTRHSKARESI